MGSLPYPFMNILNKKRTVQNASGETCAQLYERLNEGYGLTLRNFQERFNGKNAVRFGMKRIATPEEVKIMEALYPPIKQKNEACFDNKPEPKVAPVALSKKGKSVGVKAWKALVLSAKNISIRKVSLFTAFAIPTIASVSNTFLVSHALSGNTYTSLALTGVASATSLLFLWAGVKGFTSWAVVLLTLGFEGFCNAASVFKSLMASMAYSLTTVSGKPSEFLDMISNFTGRDHQDLATWVAVLVAVMIGSAQVSSLYELKK